MLSHAFKLKILRRAYSVESCFDASASASVAASKEMGLYGFSVLRTAKDFRRFVDDAIQRSEPEELVSHISKLPPSMEIISTMDEISNTVCSVMDSAELFRNTHPDRYQLQCLHLPELQPLELNTNTTLYNVVFVFKSEWDCVLHSEEARRAAHTLRVDFEKGGIHLPTIFYSLLDLSLFGEQVSSPRDTISIYDELKREHTSWGHVEGTHWHTRFSHLINYGADYYSYLYARCLAATIWQEICSVDLLSENTGNVLRTSFLCHGGAKDPADLLKGCTEGNIIRNCNGGVIPDITSLCREIGLLSIMGLK